MVIQTNADGSHPAAPNPGGRLYASRSSVTGGIAWVGPNLASDGLDLFVDPPGHRGEARALAFVVNTSGGQALVLKVFDNTNAVIAEHTFVGLGHERLAVIATDQSLFRIHLFAPSGFFDVGAIDVYLGTLTVIPEATAVVPLAGLLSFGLRCPRAPLPAALRASQGGRRTSRGAAQSTARPVRKEG